MGWKITASTRDAWLGPALAGKDTTNVENVEVVFVDGPAMARYMMVGKTARSPKSVARSVWNMVSSKATKVVIGFDDPNIGDPCNLRDQVAIERAQRCTAEPLPDDVALSITEAALPTTDGRTATWEEQLASRVGKRAAFLCLADALKRIVIEEASEDQTQSVTITPPFGGRSGKESPWHFPFNSAGPFAEVLATRPCGEAEGQIAHCAKNMIETALERNNHPPKWSWISIDTDAFVQSLGFPPINGTLVVGRGYEYRDVIYASETAALKARNEAGAKRRKVAPQKVWRHYSLDKITSTILKGHSAGLFARSQLLMMCAAGVDYCSGLGRYGWTSQRLLDEIYTGGKVIVQTDQDMSIDVIVFQKMLRRSRRQKRGDSELTNFLQELCRIVYCVRYYSWGDPSKVTYDLTEFDALGATTIDGWLSSSFTTDSYLVPIGARQCAGSGTEPLRRYNVFTN